MCIYGSVVKFALTINVSPPLSLTSTAKMSHSHIDPHSSSITQYTHRYDRTYDYEGTPYVSCKASPKCVGPLSYAFECEQYYGEGKPVPELGELSDFYIEKTKKTFYVKISPETWEEWSGWHFDGNTIKLHRIHNPLLPKLILWCPPSGVPSWHTLKEPHQLQSIFRHDLEKNEASMAPPPVFDLSFVISKAPNPVPIKPIQTASVFKGKQRENAHTTASAIDPTPQEDDVHMGDQTSDHLNDHWQNGTPGRSGSPMSINEPIRPPVNAGDGTQTAPPLCQFPYQMMRHDPERFFIRFRQGIEYSLKAGLALWAGAITTALPWFYGDKQEGVGYHQCFDRIKPNAPFRMPRLFITWPPKALM